MRFRNLIETAALFVQRPRVAVEAVRWPKFSLTSYRLVSRLRAQGIFPRCVIDVGANVGQFAVAAAKLWPEVTVHCFEPVPGSVQRLRAHVAKLPRINVHTCALGEEAGRIEMRVNRHSHSSSILPLAQCHRDAFPDAEEIGMVSVDVSTLDRVFAGTALPGPVLLKLDVQGYEAKVLRGGRNTLQQVEYVVLETSFRELYEGELLFPDLLEVMRQLGFRFDRPVGWLTAPRGEEVLQMDALFRR